MEKKYNVRYMSNNEANRVTRESICTALLDLMDKQDFNSISISAIVTRAGVSRQSFYRNYSTKEDVIIEIEETILSSFAASLEDPKYKDDLRAWVIDLLKILQDNRKLVDILGKAGLTNVLISRAPFIIEDWMGAKGMALHYFIVGSLGALRGICMEWISNGMKESPQSIADICMSYDPAVLMKKETEMK